MTDKDGGKDGEDPTADFLAEVRPEETPWRTDRPPGEEASEHAERPEKWGRTRAAAPYLQAAAVAGWLVAGSLADSADPGPGPGPGPGDA